MGTIIGTLYPPSPGNTTNVPTSPATHVSIIAITSTLARIFTGTLSDYLAPVTLPRRYRASISSLHSLSKSQHRFTVSRVAFLITFALILSLGQVLLAVGIAQQHGERFWAVSALIGSGYGAAFSLTPIIISVVWGVENFGTNWGIVAMVPALGATIYSVIYSWFYQRAVAPRGLGVGAPESDGPVEDMLCYGKECYAETFWIMSVSVWVACGLWMWAWKGPAGWCRRGIAV